jgi:hypothetical protein
MTAAARELLILSGPVNVTDLSRTLRTLALQIGHNFGLRHRVPRGTAPTASIFEKPLDVGSDVSVFNVAPFHRPGDLTVAPLFKLRHSLH